MAISPLDGRYSKSTQGLREYFSEYALFKYRIKVEVEWLKFLFENEIIKNHQEITALDMVHLDDIYLKFDLEGAKRVKDIEKVTNHDVKAIEYYIKEKLDSVAVLSQLKEYVHFCCTSEDINNLAYSLILKESK